MVIDVKEVLTIAGSVFAFIGIIWIFAKGFKENKHQHDKSNGGKGSSPTSATTTDSSSESK